MELVQALGGGWNATELPAASQVTSKETPRQVNEIPPAPLRFPSRDREGAGIGPTNATIPSMRNWILASAAVLVLAVASAAVVLTLHWPFTQAAVTKALEDRFARDVKIAKFRVTYFPPGCVAEGIEFLHRQRKDLPPLITVQTLTIRAGYTGLLHNQANDVQVAGLQCTGSTQESRRVATNLSDSPTARRARI